MIWRMDATLFSYCIHCWGHHNFNLVDGEWRCENCQGILVKAGER